MEDKKYSKLKKSFEATQPKIPTDFTDRVMKCIEQPVHTSSHRRLWPYTILSIAAAACIVLLFYVGGLRNNLHDEKPHLVAQADTTKTTPQTESKKEFPIEKGEMVDTVKKAKETLRMSRTPKHYMAKAETEAIAPEPDIIDEEVLVERAFAEERRRMEMVMMTQTQMQGSLQSDFKRFVDEIRSRGERMSQHVEMAMNEDE